LTISTGDFVVAISLTLGKLISIKKKNRLPAERSNQCSIRQNHALNELETEAKMMEVVECDAYRIYNKVGVADVD